MSTKHQDPTSHPSGAIHRHGPTPTRPWQVRVGLWLPWAYARLSIAEARDSVRRFGDAYSRYMTEVPRFIPRRRRAGEVAGVSK